MQKITTCFICILALLAFVIPAAMGEDYQNATSATKVLRVGMANTKPVNNLDVYGSKAMYNIEAYARIKPAFNASQRLGMTANFSYNTDIYKPIYNVSAYSRIKPIYEIPSFLKPKPIYNIADYPVIKAPNSIP